MTGSFLNLKKNPINIAARLPKHGKDTAESHQKSSSPDSVLRMHLFNSLAYFGLLKAEGLDDRLNQMSELVDVQSEV